MKSQLFCFVLCIWLFSCQENTKLSVKKTSLTSIKDYQLTVDIKGIKSGKAYLNVVKNKELIKIDSAYLHENIYRFSNKLEEPLFVWLTFESTSQGLPLILENARISVIGSVLYLRESHIKGGNINDNYVSFKKESALFLSKIDTRYQRFQKARLENNNQQLQIIHKEISDIKDAYIQFCIQYVLKCPNSFVSLIILNDLIDEQVNKQTLNSTYSACSERIKNLKFGQSIFHRIQKL